MVKSSFKKTFLSDTPFFWKSRKVLISGTTHFWGILPLYLITCQIFLTAFRGTLTEHKGFLKTDMPPGEGIPFFKILHVILSLPYPAGTCQISQELHAHNLCYLFSFSCVTQPPSPCCKLPNSNSVCDTLERTVLVSFFSQTSSSLC